MIRRVRQEEAYGLTFPLLTTASGAKMGKTAAGAVWLDPSLTTPYDFFQYFVNVDDRDVLRFLKLLTFEPLESIQNFETAQGADLRDAKRLLARTVTTIVHGRAIADEVDAAARAAFGGFRVAATGNVTVAVAGVGAQASAGQVSGTLTALPTVTVSRERLAAGLKIVDVLAESGLAASKNAARRLIEQGGVRVGDRKVTSIDEVLRPDDIGGGGALLHAGKKHLRRLIWE